MGEAFRFLVIRLPVPYLKVISEFYLARHFSKDLLNLKKKEERNKQTEYNLSHNQPPYSYVF